MGKKPGPKAAKILQRYQEEQERTEAVSGAADTPRDALDRARLKQFEASQHFLRDFIPVTTASGRGVKGKVKLFLQRLFRKCTLYIFTQLSERIFRFQGLTIETIGELYRAAELMDGQRNADREEILDLGEQLREAQAASEAEAWKIYQKMEEENQKMEEENQALRKQIQENKAATEAEAWKIDQKMEEENQALRQQIQESKAASVAEDWKIYQRIGADKTELQHHLDEQQRVIGAAARDLMRTKWQLRDHVAEKTDLSERIIRCNICGYEAKEGSFKTVETDCIFAGGHLKRYECPECGCIFGPLKFSDQTESEFSDDYTVHYAGFFETDCTWKERWAFELLHPRKDGVYLDYGCGKWSHTIRELREEGYEVWGYEPYAADVDNPYIITDREALEKMRFDGIFSNDLLEHLADPVADMRFMAGLLRSADSRIAHNTSCYAYKYEFTRFHMHFFTGKSVQVLAEKAGLRITGCVNELETKDLYCYIYAPKEETNA